MANRIRAHANCTGPHSVDISHPVEDVRRLDRNGNIVEIKSVRFRVTKEYCSCGGLLSSNKKVI